jgi:hypothetical protein
MVFAFEMWLTAGATSQQEMLTPPKHLIPPLVYPEVRVCSVLGFVFPTSFMRLITVRYLCYFMYDTLPSGHKSDQTIYFKNTLEHELQ